MASIFAHERPLPAIVGAVIMRNTYYDRAHLQASVDWARGKLASGNCSPWERQYLLSQIERIELALTTGRAA
jgi:hypothetical protein